MIVRYSKERGYQGEGKDPNITLGRSYLVLGITFRPDGYSNLITIQSDSSGTPSLFDLDCFEVLDAALPSGWCFFELGRGRYYRLEPKEFGGEFWDIFNDTDDENAEQVFAEVVRKLRAFHGW